MSLLLRRYKGHPTAGLYLARKTENRMNFSSLQGTIFSPFTLRKLFYLCGYLQVEVNLPVMLNSFQWRGRCPRPRHWLTTFNCYKESFNQSEKFCMSNPTPWPRIFTVHISINLDIWADGSLSSNIHFPLSSLQLQNPRSPLSFCECLSPPLHHLATTISSLPCSWLWSRGWERKWCVLSESLC